MKRAFIFPGQGAQYVGMGKDFFDSFRVAKETFEEADDLLNEGLSKIIFEGPEEVLTETKTAQVAIFVTSIAIWRTLQE
jgi:[acyl-carrier-protein] S-malonyltransferase